MEKRYLCVDLKTFYASVECVERGLDPFHTNLVVADPSRGQGGLCLAISPKMKAMGVKNRCRLFEIPSHIKYITALPRMNLYMQYASNIYEIYLKYVSKEDIHVYSIDEAFLDITPYLHLYDMNEKEIAHMILNDVYATYGITATVGIGTNLYLAKIALDLLSKHAKDNMGYLDETLYKEKLWDYTPITDFWHVGKGIAKRLEKYGFTTMRDVASCDVNILKKEFGINGEYLYDHAWGKEPTTMKDIKGYTPNHHSLSNNQILFEDYTYENALLVLKEMVESNVIEMVDKHLVSNHISLFIGYSKNMRPPTGGSKKIDYCSNSLHIFMKEFEMLFKKSSDPYCPIRQIGISFGNVKDEYFEAYDLFTDMEKIEEERNLSITLAKIKHKYGKNAILKGMNLMEKATAKKRNTLVGGHNAK